MPEGDELLVKRAQQGDSTALEELLLAYEKRVYNLTYRFMGNEADAYDMAQEALIKIYRGISTFKKESSFSSWVYRLCVNTCMDGLRKKKRIPLSLDHSIEQGMSFEDLSIATPEAHALSLERSEDIQKAINILSDVHRSVIILRDINGLSYEEISKCLDVSVGTVKSRINRGRQRLRELLIHC
ncbi:MAG: sigma-70 family RNA polymerase sigma factor [Christensenellales bacterium]|jgi:RNA polymerase sigma-70 factor (ECF subfamily)